MSQIVDDDIAKGINYLSDFKVVHIWAKDYVKYDGHDDVEPVHIFWSGSGETGKAHLVKVIYNAISTTLLHHRTDSENFYLDPQGYQQ